MTATMIDIHCHLLPGIDDGAPTLEEALAMCQLAAADGCTTMIATPHLRHQYWWNDDREAIEDLHRKTRTAVSGAIDLRLGGEIAVHSESCSELDELPNGALLTLAGSRYVLLEFERRGLTLDPFELIHELQIAGFVPIIAHPERIVWMAERPALLREMAEEGALLQLTGLSVTGQLGRQLQNLSLDWLAKGWVDFIASDAHRLEVRPPGLSEAYRTVQQHWGEQAAERIFVENPQAILDDRPLSAA